MGIENFRSGPDHRKEGRTHYPSWESKTTCRGAPGRTPPAHYPSWGSKTADRRMTSHHARQLITPHGDRKPVCSHGRHTLHVLSLPLMGIENQRIEGDAGIRLRALITPHGDRKHLGPVTVIEPISVSLPLMGIENRWTMPATTPSATCTHYPSWGSKTRAAPAARLPPRPPHYPSWGSKTSCRRRTAGHQPRAHYPSWGSKTRVGQRPLPSKTPISANGWPLRGTL